MKTKLQAALDGLQKHSQPFTIISKVEVLVEIKDNTRPISNTSYHPKIISIGPYHRGKEKLRSMEKTKLKYFRDFLLRCDQDRSPFDQIVDAAIKLEDEVRECYSEVVSIKHDEFVEMLVLDGCFILEFLLKFNSGGGEVYQSMSMANWSVPVVTKDLLLFENQMPFFVLIMFYCVARINKLQNPCPSDVLELALGFLSNGTLTTLSEEYSQIEPYHLLHLFHISLHPNYCLDLPAEADRMPSPPIFRQKISNNLMNTDTTSSSILQLVPAAGQLQNSGVKFKSVEGEYNFLNIRFENGTLVIPSLIINYYTISLVLNLLAFEQSRDDAGNYVTSYAAFMNNIVKTTRDVAVLQEFHIIKRQLFNDDKVVFFFSRIGDRENRIWREDDRNYLDGIIREVNVFYNNPLRRCKATATRILRLRSTTIILSLLAIVTSTVIALLT